MTGFCSLGQVCLKSRSISPRFLKVVVSFKKLNLERPFEKVRREAQLITSY
jgi:hypothetical protein